MQHFLSRLRAALTPGVLLTALALFLLYAGMVSARSNGLSDLEKSAGRTLSSLEGAGRVRVTIRMQEVTLSGTGFGAQKTMQVPCGAIAVAQGADDPLVEIRLRDALCTLLGLEPASVSIVAGGWE